MAILMDGKALAEKRRGEIALAAEHLRGQGVVPCLAVILVGEDPASALYVRNKHKACLVCDIESREYKLPGDTTRETLDELVDRLNGDDTVSGILIQSPLPAGLPEREIVARILPEKDVDAFHPQNVGRILRGDYTLAPCTPMGVMEFLKAYQIPTRGKKAVVVGRSDIVGKPMAALLLHADCTVTVCHSKTEHLAEETRSADILVSAVGRAGFITEDMVKPGACVIDVGMNRGADGKFTGDVDFAAVEPRAGWITPVPGGVGPMTVTELMQNTVTAAACRAGIRLP